MQERVSMKQYANKERQERQCLHETIHKEGEPGTSALHVTMHKQGEKRSCMKQYTHKERLQERQCLHEQYTNKDRQEPA